MIVAREEKISALPQKFKKPQILNHLMRIISKSQPNPLANQKILHSTHELVEKLTLDRREIVYLQRDSKT